MLGKVKEVDEWLVGFEDVPTKTNMMIAENMSDDNKSNEK